MDFSGAVVKSGDGVIITLDVSPGSRKAAFPAGYNEWRNAIVCRVKAPATGGKANTEVIGTISDSFSVKKSDVSIVAGMTSTLKKIRVAGLGTEEVLSRLSGSPDP